MSILTKVMRIYERIEGYLALFAITLIISIMLMVTIDVTGRYIFNKPLLAAQELSENSLVWFTFLSAAWILKREKHVMVTILVDRLKPRVRSLLGIITSVIGAVVCFVIVIFGISAALETFQHGVIQIYTLGLPLAPLYIVIPLGSAFLVIRFILRTYKYLEEWRMPAKKEAEQLEKLVEY